ncbi:hypothetical protein N7516_001507 [Penicillium verrucosum]|uniref:uncharacterized protein n=1 Tax=Penicillium verrucosum TaxID=60171 RepID=UPI002544F971|nr:uncharacterized protein N7516_001507 [Penicillium verrucosum]KAJ5941339.1 hypothetical protein N7516_001507 [Penicillium verrucosum]
MAVFGVAHNCESDENVVFGQRKEAFVVLGAFQKTNICEGSFIRAEAVTVTSNPSSVHNEEMIGAKEPIEE